MQRRSGVMQSGDSDDRQLGPPRFSTKRNDRLCCPALTSSLIVECLRKCRSWRPFPSLFTCAVVLCLAVLLNHDSFAHGQHLPMYSSGPNYHGMRGNPCQNFTPIFTSENEGHFFSPNYPNPYPKNVECQFQISAPPGKNIKLDFRGEFFELEPSDRSDQKCEETNDYLEVRDGAHGYSTLRGRFCGTDFPDPIISSDRHLWLSFKSDENIEMRGFQGVFTFVNNSGDTPDRDACRFELSGIHGLINYRQIPDEQRNFTRKHAKRLDCTWEISVEEGYKILLTFLTFSLEQPNECGINFMDIYGEKTNEQNNLQHFCGSMAESTMTPGHMAHVRFVSEIGGLESKFNLSYNAIRDTTTLNGTADDKCYDDEFDCTDGTCIAKSLLCNGIHNCKFMQDEMESECKALEPDTKKFAESHILVIMTIGCMLLGGMCFIMMFNCFRKLRNDRREYKERRSAEDSLDRSRPASAISTPSQARPRSMRGSELNLVASGSRPSSTAPGGAVRSSGSVLGSRSYLYQPSGSRNPAEAALTALPPPPPPSVTDPQLVYPPGVYRQGKGRQGTLQRQDTLASSSGMPRTGSASHLSLRAASRQTLTKETQTPTARSSASPTPSPPRSSLSGDEVDDDDMGSSPPPPPFVPSQPRRYAQQQPTNPYYNYRQPEAVYHQQALQTVHSRGPSESSDERLLLGGRMKSFRPPSGAETHQPLPPPGPIYHPPAPAGPAQVWEPMTTHNTHQPQKYPTRFREVPHQSHHHYHPQDPHRSHLGKSPSVKSMPACSGDCGQMHYYSTLPHSAYPTGQEDGGRGVETMPRYRAEAVIQMGLNQDQAGNRRPQSSMSQTSTKSAPDVIVLH